MTTFQAFCHVCIVGSSHDWSKNFPNFDWFLPMPIEIQRAPPVFPSVQIKRDGTKETNTLFTAMLGLSRPSERRFPELEFYDQSVNVHIYAHYMIFQQELNAQAFFTPSVLNPSTIYSVKTTPMTREERILRRRQEKRRRQIQEIKAGCKRFMAMLFSHIGLSGLVVAYTIIGALLFGKIEQGFERDIKNQARIYRENSTLSIIRFIFENFYDAVGNSQLDCNQTVDLIHVILWYVEKAQNELQPAPDLFDNRQFVLQNDTDFSNFTLDTWLNQTSDSAENVTFNSTTTPLPLTTTTSLKMIDVNHQIWVKNLQRDIDDKLLDFIRKIVEFIEDDGWNGNDSLEDLKWSYAGAVLYAITVITTIGSDGTC
ncbi:unnamed protein product [Echinostoma caproni]|uniref:Ion_trans_2 domain-containing protein n=1 Tax=Echinostoma caproni TaxID=27848 RepID=A0A183AC65_9TREM|nr:unnamed protein product [Echinostoma caproni]